MTVLLCRWLLAATAVLYAVAGLAESNAVRRDFDGDGKADILWRNATSGDNYLYPMDGTAIKPSEGYLRRVADQNWHIVGVGDFNADGNADILWRNSATGENYIYLMSGTTIIGEGYLRTVPSQDWQVAGSGDYNGDGTADILWRNRTSGENYVYLMSGTSIVGEGYLRTVADQNWWIAGSGDFNGDGRSDVLWRNVATGQNYVYLMNGTAIIGEGFLRTVSDLAWKIVGVGDFNNDGKADVLWRNASTGENYLYPMDGTTILGGEGYLRTVANTAWRVAQVADFDGDGRADILWRNSSTGENYLYPMSGTAIKPTEGYVRTVADTAWQVQYALAGPAPVPPPTETVVTLAPVADNTLYESATGDISNGAGAHFFAGRTGVNGIRRALLKFDVAGRIPSGATITSATLTLHVSRVSLLANHSMTLHRVLPDWGEGTSNAVFNEGQGAPATTNDATWLHRFYPNVQWVTAGGDFSATASATTMVGGIADYSWSGPGLAADVSMWLANPTAQRGWLLKGVDETVTNSAKQFASRENTDATARPRLEVRYTLP
jgi:hypothetical protein